MPWPIHFTVEFETWFDTQPDEVKAKIAAKFERLIELGPNLGRHDVDTLEHSQLSNLKELRVSVNGAPYRLLFAFDSLRRATFLCGGDKAGQKRFYKRMIPLAEARFARHEESLRQRRQEDGT